MPTAGAEEAGAVPLALIVGAPRSGTTWLQRSLAGHPHVASPQETHLFTGYLRHLYARWERDRRQLESVLVETSSGGSSSQRAIGLSTILRDEDLDAAARSLVDALVRRCLELKPGARMVVEKTPPNAQRIGLIDAIVPSSRFVHVIRDPRDVTASLLAARRDMNWAWAPRSADGAGRLWYSHVHAARTALADPSRYLEVRYEDLRSDTTRELARVTEFLGLQGGHDLTAQASLVMLPEVRARLGGTHVEPRAFAGDGRPRHSLTLSQRLAVERQAGALLAELGYAGSERWPEVPLRRRVLAQPRLAAGAAARAASQAVLQRLPAGQKGR